MNPPPPPPLRNHVFSTENNQKLAFSDPPSPPTSDYVIYEWSLAIRRLFFTKNKFDPEKRHLKRSQAIVSVRLWCYVPAILKLYNLGVSEI